MSEYNFLTYNEMFTQLTSKYNNPTFLNYLNLNNEYESISSSEFKDKVICLAAALENLGITKGDRIAIFTVSSPFWLIFDFAIQQLGATSVPIFANISTKNLTFELKDSNCKFVFLDDINRVNDIPSKVKIITHQFCIDQENVFNLDDILITGKDICNVNGYKQHIYSEDEVFSIIYTSGNTGTPKGVILSHKNIISQIKDIDKIIALDKTETILSLLPLAHIFERVVMSYYLSRGVSIYFVDEIPNVAKLLKVVRPTMMTVVPRLLEKIFNKIELNISTKPFISRLLASSAFKYALSSEIDKESIKFKIFDKIVYSKLRNIFGGRISKLVSGGAALDKTIYQFFLNIGIPLYQGYGQTEFSPVISTNYPKNNKVGTTGKPMPSVEVKIVDKELYARGPSVMLGYLNQEELTSQTIDKEGWLHTGDVASIDKEGYITIKSRQKDIFKTSTGEYVNAIEIEQKLSTNKYIEFAVIVSENRQYTTALFFVDQERFLNVKKLHKNLTLEEYYERDKVHKSIETTIEDMNKNLNKWERVVHYRLVFTQATIEGGELTPSMKVCRDAIWSKYENIINSMY